MSVDVDCRTVTGSCAPAVTGVAAAGHARGPSSFVDKVGHPKVIHAMRSGYGSNCGETNNRVVTESETLSQDSMTVSPLNTGRPGRDVSSPAHRPVRGGYGGYSGEKRNVPVDGVEFDFAHVDVESKNSAGQEDPSMVCGGGRQPNDSAVLADNGSPDTTINKSTSSHYVKAGNFTVLSDGGFISVSQNTALPEPWRDIELHSPIDSC